MSSVTRKPDQARPCEGQGKRNCDYYWMHHAEQGLTEDLRAQVATLGTANDGLRQEANALRTDLHDQCGVVDRLTRANAALQQANRHNAEVYDARTDALHRENMTLRGHNVRQYDEIMALRMELQHARETNDHNDRVLREVVATTRRDTQRLRAELERVYEANDRNAHLLWAAQDKLEAIARRPHSARCAFGCGLIARVPTAAEAEALAAAHLATCPTHPIRAVEARHADLREENDAALAELADAMQTIHEQAEELEQRRTACEGCLILREQVEQLRACNAQATAHIRTLEHARSALIRERDVLQVDLTHREHDVAAMASLLHRWRRELDSGLTRNGPLLRALNAALGIGWQDESPAQPPLEPAGAADGEDGA